MSSVGRSGRSFEHITIDDLARLAKLAKDDRASFFAKHPNWGRLYARRVLCTALCQGAATHYVYGEVGINDFDVYTFYSAHPKRSWPSRRIKHTDFGDPKFGRSVEKSTPIGRRVDLMARSIPARQDENPASAVRRYLRSGKTATARHLARNAVVLIEPVQFVGLIVWPVE